MSERKIEISACCGKPVFERHQAATIHNKGKIKSIIPEGARHWLICSQCGKETTSKQTTLNVPGSKRRNKSEEPILPFGGE